MGSPLHISGSASTRYYPNASSTELKALCSIAESFPHPQRAIMSSFIQRATDQDIASQYFLAQVSAQDPVTVFNRWISILRETRPILCSDSDLPFLRHVQLRDAARCCISNAQDEEGHDSKLLLVYILSPQFLLNIDVVENRPLREMLIAFIGEANVQKLCTLVGQTNINSKSSQVLLLSPQMFDHFRHGRVSLQSGLLSDLEGQVRYLISCNIRIPGLPVDTESSADFMNHNPNVTSLPDPDLLETHHRFADALAWLDASEYMAEKIHLPKASESQTARSSKQLFPISTWLCSSMNRLFHRLWVSLPGVVRAFTYKCLASIGSMLYGHTGSDRTYRLPFNLYLRVGQMNWASKHQAEMRSLQLVEKYTEIPAPRGIDVVHYGASSFLLMSRCPGQRIGLMFSTMTDENVHSVEEELRRYISQLRRIPNQTRSKYQICNALGGGIQDWRIGDSQREELKFLDEPEFNRYLTHDLPPLTENDLSTISKAHNKSHSIFFTHADLNLLNVLVDDNGRISGIVDWECAGWYPEYWEYTKAHFTVRYTIRWIADVIDRLFPNYQDELQAENLLTSLTPPW
ncbi:hypothetical protein EJ05DRAFT_539695 [Pseudovirgaria hyperparasitica]|uniref:Aminoglycoside phosphotransferase domain-containing protein n=1 Tax=Pseudovirgaria hyperparasitica TaxID=470096 RepID=A0A6A6W166_9PEZI|nr:uncharacterized protein EJ05DRAFT_539695 [Pseudovirgaria hyperparasitica]KAF2755836.1 hypothetical protein EJ05DRAFT_539695 [Pseudovirgaria hyperparasitica]